MQHDNARPPHRGRDARTRLVPLNGGPWLDNRLPAQGLGLRGPRRCRADARQCGHFPASRRAPLGMGHPGPGRGAGRRSLLDSRPSRPGWRGSPFKRARNASVDAPWRHDLSPLPLSPHARRDAMRPVAVLLGLCLVADATSAWPSAGRHGLLDVTGQSALRELAHHRAVCLQPHRRPVCRSRTGNQAGWLRR